MKFLKIIIPFIIVLSLSYLIVKPIFIPGFFPIHDDTQASRVFELTKALKDGMFPARWVSDLGYGYGYPIFNFYAPLAYYVGSAFMLLNFDALMASKIMMAFGVVLSGVFMYLLGKEFWGRLGGIVSAAFYLFVPYHAVDIFVRGDVAELWAYAFIPLAFLGIYKIFKTNGKVGWIIVGSLGYAGIILSHNLTAMMVSPFLLAFILFEFFRNKKNIYVGFSSLISFLLGLMLSAFYFVPALLENKYTNVISQVGGAADFRNNFVCLTQLWQSQWGFGGSAPGCLDGVSFMIGKVQIVSFFLALILLVTFLIMKKNKSENNNRVGIIVFSVVGFLTCVLLMLSISEPIWSALSPMRFFQYPWRFLLLTSFFSALASGSLIWLTTFLIRTKWIGYVISFTLLVMVILFNQKFFIPQTIIGKTSADYTNPPVLKWAISKISDEYMPKNFIKPLNEKDVVSDKVILSSKDGVIESENEKTQEINLNINVLRETTVYFNIAYFPAWQVFIDNNSVKYQYANNEYSVIVPSGNHILSMKFVETPIEKVSNVISLVGIVCVALGIIGFRKKLFYAK